MSSNDVSKRIRCRRCGAICRYPRLRIVLRYQRDGWGSWGTVCTRCASKVLQAASPAQEREA